MIADVAALGIPELALTTNAQLLAPRAEALRSAGLQRINISLDSLRPDGITAGRRLDAVLATAFARKRGERFIGGVATMASVGG